jgi:polyketide synthase PksL
MAADQLKQTGAPAEPHVPVEIDPHDRTLLERIGRLRVLAWSTVMPDATRRTACWLDEFDPVARHWCIFHDSKPVAAARISVHQRLEEVPDALIYEGVFATPPASPVASFNRLVVHPEHRGGGLSRKLDDVRLKAAISLGCRSIIVVSNVGSSRLGQLRGLGFRTIGTAGPYPQHHFLDESGAVLCCDLAAREHGIQTTANRMGWSGDAVNEVSQQFIRYAAECGQPVLDIGAAYGVATIPALAAGARVYANDLSPDHLAELRRRTPPEVRDRLNTLPGRFPHDLSFPDNSLGAVHASQVFHFLTPAEVETGLQLAFRWLRPGGRLFVLAATPYQATHAAFASVFLERKASGNPWPGVIEDIRAYNKHWSADLVPPWLHVFDDEVLASAVRQAGFEIESVQMCSRTGLPDFCRFDGRENLCLVARKPARASQQHHAEQAVSTGMGNIFP